jgi:hypothetical protein
LNTEGCSSEYECQLSQGCFDGKCTDYFSLPDGTDLGANKYKNSQSFCSSGFDRHGVCDSLKNINADEKNSDELVKCDELNPCRYSSMNGTITENNVCKCGKSSDGSRYCPIYGGNKYARFAVDQIKKIISSNGNNCNTVERDGVCNHYKLNSANDPSVVTYDTLRTKLASFNEFYNSQECIRKIFYPLYNKEFDKQPDDPFDPNGKKCPVFRCNSENHYVNKVCAKNLVDTKDNKTYVDLFRKSCDFNSQFCNFDRTYFGLDTKESLCQNRDKKLLQNRYPGESCETDEQCFLHDYTPVEGLGKCTNNKCSGFSRGTNCTLTSQCLPGLYCKNSGVNHSTCQNQESEKAKCSSMYDCKNNLVCYQDICQNIFYSLNAGEKFSNKNFYDSDKVLARTYLCKFGQAKELDEENSVCLMKKQTDQGDSKQSNLVACTPGQFCNYTLTDNNNINESFTSTCECGFSGKGQGYCKAGNNISKFYFFYKIN